MKPFRSSDGTWWGVTVQLPSHSSAMVVFHHPDGATSRRDRYAWLNSHGAASSDPRARLDKADALANLADHDLARLFIRSMPVHVDRPGYVVS